MRSLVFPSLKQTAYLSYVEVGGYQEWHTMYQTALYSVFWTDWYTSFQTQSGQNQYVLTDYFVARNTASVAQTAHQTTYNTSHFTYVQYWHNPSEPDITQWETAYSTGHQTAYDTSSVVVTQYYSGVWTAVSVESSTNTSRLTSVQTGISTIRWTGHNTGEYVAAQTAYNTWHYTRW